MVPDDPAGPTGNLLLDRLPDADRTELAPLFERVVFQPREELYPPDAPAERVFFPASGVYTLAIPVGGNGRAVEVADVGREGVIGPAAEVVGFAPEVLAVAQVRGVCLRLSAEAFRAAAARPAVGRAVRRYAVRCWRAGLQAIACCRPHPIEARLPFLLLRTLDRVDADEFELTQTVLADMLGASRQTVTVTAGALQRAGAITYRRGVVRVLDRGRLEQVSCECYAVMRRLTERLNSSG